MEFAVSWEKMEEVSWIDAASWAVEDEAMVAVLEWLTMLSKSRSVVCGIIRYS